MNYRYKDFTIINPLMRGGIVPKDVSKRLYEEGWLDVGYNVCHECIKGRSSLVTKPKVKSFLQEVANFFGGDAAACDRYHLHAETLIQTGISSLPCRLD